MNGLARCIGRWKGGFEALRREVRQEIEAMRREIQRLERWSAGFAISILLMLVGIIVQNLVK